MSVYLTETKLKCLF